MILVGSDTMITSAQINLLIGKTVEMICFAQYSVYLHLEGRVTLTIESEFESGLVDAERIQRAKFPIRQSSLTRIVESLVTTAELNKDGNLRLLFSTGDSLQVLTQPPFESYRLRIGGEEFIA